MDIIARFPRLPTEAVEEAPTSPTHLERLPTPSPTLSRRSVRQPAFPGLSVVLLAVVAAVVWSLAAWNDSVRLARQQRPERLAARPVVSSQTASP